MRRVSRHADRFAGKRQRNGPGDPRFGIEEEARARGDPLAGFDAARDENLLFAPFAELDLARFEPPLRDGDEDRLAQPRIENRRGRQYSGGASAA